MWRVARNTRVLPLKLQTHEPRDTGTGAEHRQKHGQKHGHKRGHRRRRRKMDIDRKSDGRRKAWESKEVGERRESKEVGERRNPATEETFSPLSLSM